MADIQLNVLLLGVFILLSPVTKGVHGQCSTPPVNQVVYEDSENVSLTCNSPTGVSWTVTPTDNELHPSTITNYSDTVVPSLTDLYSVDQTNLLIKTAQSSSETSSMSTSGFYGAQFSPSGPNNKVGAKLVVVRQGPTCGCTAINSTSNRVTCSITFADSSYSPIYARVTWTADENYNTSVTLSARTRVNNAYTSTAAIIINATDPRTYQCTVTFTKPNSIHVPYIATNVPDFYAICTPNSCSDCPANLRNIAVYEGQPNTIMNLYLDPRNVSWKVLPTSDELDTYTIVNYGGARDPTLTGLYDVDQTGLIIKDATTNGNPISTAGLYTGQCANNPDKFGAKLLVVRTGPLCSCTPNDNSSYAVSCSVTYGDSSLHPIYPVVTWKLNGIVLQSETLSRTRVDAVFYSESTIITDYSGSPGEYECELTFAAPTNIQFSFVATNAPEFKESCSACGMTTTSEPPTTTSTSSTECDCTQTTSCPPPVQNCTRESECGFDGTNMAALLDECVVKAELYARCDKCCAEDLVCGVVVTLRNDSRWLIHDSLCGDNQCQMVAVDASCMSSDWKLLTERKIIISGVRDFVNAGDSAGTASGESDCSDSCKTMMNLF